MIVLESFPTQQQLLSEEIEEKMPVFWKNHDFFFFQKEKYSQKSKRSPSVSAPLKTGRSRAGENIDVTSSLFNLFLGKRLQMVLCVEIFQQQHQLPETHKNAPKEKTFSSLSHRRRIRTYLRCI
jgi:hypothetical protein